ncbi:RNA polymerase sigma factor [Streptomyces sp. NPDC058783]|uniref:RNA polymerase sigma factor n=1 Tax=Streptomyces sp. NPDC058783 TaxID=3346633 RepID=UPI003682001B
MAASKQPADAQAAQAAWASALPRRTVYPDPPPARPTAHEEESRAIDEAEGLRLMLDLEPQLRRFMTLHFGMSTETAEDTVAGIRDRWMQRLRDADLAQVKRPEAYLWTAARAAAIDHLRRARRRREVLVDSNDWDTFEPYITHASSAEDIVTYGEMDEKLVAKVQSLPHMQRRVIELLFFEDYSLKETAALLDLAPSTAARYRLRALSTLRTLYTHSRQWDRGSHPERGTS